MGVHTNLFTFFFFSDSCDVDTFFCSSAARGQRAGGAAAVADGSSCRAENEPGLGRGLGTILSLPHSPVDQ